MASNENKTLPIVLNALFDRNQDIIQKYLSEISRSNRAYYYIDNKVYGCIYEIAEKERRVDLIPKCDETLSEWRERSGIPHEYLELEVYLNNLFSNKQRDLFKQRKEYGEDKDKFVELPITDVHLEQLQTEGKIQIEQGQSEPKPDKYKPIYIVIFIFLILIGPGIVVNSATFGPGIAALVFIIYFITLFGVHLWAYEKGYWRFPTKEEKEAEKEERMRKWGEPIKSAHIIRLERGLYTGLGNRRPYPHGRRTKKY